jgi:hypothetical protein
MKDPTKVDAMATLMVKLSADRLGKKMEKTKAELSVDAKGNY